MKPLYEFDQATRRLLIEQHLLWRRGGDDFSAPMEGAYGQVYFFRLNDARRTKIAAKCPHIRRFGTLEKARAGIEQLLYELEKTHGIYMVPWINRFFDVQFIHGWPFLLSRCRDGTLEDLILDPNRWTLEDRLTCLLQITRALRMARDRGIAAHQDLKPANIFFDDLETHHNVPKNSKGMHFHFFVADFGIANAFRDFAPIKNSGSRPYMAPEQFSEMTLQPNVSPSFDCFALGVIFHELLTDGRHPIGVNTSDVWPWHAGIAQKWNRAATWRDWAVSQKKDILAGASLPSKAKELVLSMLSPEPEARPSLKEIENSFWEILNKVDPDTSEGMRLQIDYLESFSKGEQKWEHMDERLHELREFYASQ